MHADFNNYHEVTPYFSPTVLLETKGALLLSGLAGETRQFAKKMRQFEGTLAR